MKSPARLILELCDKAYWHRMLRGKPSYMKKPGYFYLHEATPEEREIIKNLKAEDVQNSIRPERFWND